MRGRQARRSGPTRSAARNARFRDDTTRRVTDPRATTPEGRREHAVEEKRKHFIAAIGRDQRITRNKRAVDAYSKAYAALLSQHMERDHGVDLDAVGRDLRVWRLDARHEHLHGRES